MSRLNIGIHRSPIALIARVSVPLVPVVLAAIGAACGNSDGNAPSSIFSKPITTLDASIDNNENDDAQCIFCPTPDADDGNDIFSDFPASPIIDSPDAGGEAAPSTSAQLFGAPTAGAASGGPCLIEPEIGSLYPKNWLRPRFRWVAPSGENLFEIRLHVANQTNDLVVYTRSTQWTMPKGMWLSLSSHSSDVAMTLTVRGASYNGTSLSGEALGASGPLGIAPVSAPGAIVYWSILNGSTTALKGFSIGDESVESALAPSQVTQVSTTCIGCHNATPDGQFASFNSFSDDTWPNAFAGITSSNTGQTPSWIGAAGRVALQTTEMGIHTFSAAHWQTGDRVEISAHDANDDGNSELVWVDVGAQTGTAIGTLARTGDPLHAGAPSWSHDGTRIAYVSTDANQDGRLSDGEADVYIVPYNNKLGGTATPLQGAATAGPREYYPVWSPDDQWIGFTKAADDSMYSNPDAELYVIPSTGGSATRLVANDPPACTSKVSPGVTNSWSKWAPSVGTTADGRKFYWLVFSSTRDPNGNPQLYVTPVVVDAQNHITTYSALYLWNQIAGEDNHTPAWDNFQIPPVPAQ